MNLQKKSYNKQNMSNRHLWTEADAALLFFLKTVSLAMGLLWIVVTINSLLYVSKIDKYQFSFNDWGIPFVLFVFFILAKAGIIYHEYKKRRVDPY